MKFTPEQEAMRRVHTAFLNTELSVHAASRDAAVCQSTMQLAVDEIGVPWSVGLKPLAKVSEANALMVRARQLMIEAHSQIKKVPQILGYEGEGSPGDLGYGHMNPTPAMTIDDQRGQYPALQAVA